MAKYIKREDLAEWLKTESDKYSMKDVAPVGWTLLGLVNELDKISSADVEERKTGKWVLKTFDDGYGEYQLYECDKCGAVSAHRTNYCPNCGARMVEDGKL